ncbi:DNA-directed RNA polymerase subunit beta [Striga asiatica]|uniref:DNA-directed RNA polymerase subunit beta n=1 Tax=Striga asiatica TaxID=4170 RepID=A0A5A7NZC1_STRAF|nr:DNA-directed RNA polymerase subunit beta [Striga asiatica]
MNWTALDLHSKKHKNFGELGQSTSSVPFSGNILEILLLAFHDLHREHAPDCRRVLGHNLSKPIELTRPFILEKCLEIHVERVRHVLPPVEPAARPLGVHARAIPRRARKQVRLLHLHVVFVLRGPKHAPPMRHLLDPAGSGREHNPAMAREVDPVLVRERVQVDVDRLPRELVAPAIASNVREKCLEEPLGGGGIGVDKPVSGPPDLGDDEIDIAVPELLEGPRERVVRNLEHVSVDSVADVGYGVGRAPVGYGEAEVGDVEDAHELDQEELDANGGTACPDDVEVPHELGPE